MKAKIFFTCIYYIISFTLVNSISAQTLAFPEAVGNGRYVTGGRAGTVYHVTNLNDSGTGSFRDAVSSSNRIIVFDVGGYVKLLTAVTVKSNITVAGQTAPGGGIGFRGGKISCGKSSNIIFRHIRIRPGSEVASNEDVAINLYNAKNIIVDHCSIEFAPWNNIGGVSDDWENYPVTNVTFQNCLIANPTYQQFGAHIESVNSDWTMVNNAFVNSHNRNPLAKINDVFVNNILYNYSAGYTTHTSTKFKHDVVNNYFIMGPASTGTDNTWYQVDKNQTMYYSGNMKDKSLDGVLNGSETTPYWYQGEGTILTSPWSDITKNLTILSAASAYRMVSSISGTLPWDQMDSLIWSQVHTLGSGTTGYTAGTRGPDGSLYTSQTQTGLPNNGYGNIYSVTKPTDTDNDGMPDYWEKTNSLSTSSNDAMTIGTDGYANIEKYINFLGTLHATVNQNSYVDINLANYAAGFAKVSPTYSTSNASNGTAVIQSDGKTVRFTPTSNFSGMANFSFTVKGNDNTSYSAKILIAVIPSNLTPAPIVKINSPINGASFIVPASITINVSASDPDGTVTGVALYDGNTLLGTINSSPYTYVWNNATTGSHSITAVATDNSGQKTTSTAVVINVVTPITSIYQNASTDVWTNTANWTPASIPSSAIDTAIIRTGEVKVATDILPVIKVETYGIFRLTDSISVSDIRLQGGVLKSYTGTPVFILTSTISVEQSSTILAGSLSTSFLYLNGTVKGTGNLTKTGIGILRLNTSATSYTGIWIVSEGSLQLRNSNGLGLCGVEVDSSAILDIETSASTNALVLKPYAKLNLDANLTVQMAIFGDENLTAGTYTASSHPTFITGTGTLTVAKSILTASSPLNGTITLTAGSANSYLWSNGTETVGTSLSYSPSVTGIYSVEITNSAGCSITSVPKALQTIDLIKGWNLISTNINTPDSSIATIFNGIDVQEIKNMDAFWRKGQNSIFNSLSKFSAGKGYLVQMNSDGKLSIFGSILKTPKIIISSTTKGWSLIGCPFQYLAPFSDYFNSTNCSIIKNFDGFWIPDGTANSIQNIEPNKGYFLK